MREFVVILTAGALLGGLVPLAGCDDDGEASGAVAPPPLRTIPSIRLPAGKEQIIVDGNGADEGWKGAREFEVPLRGEGPASLTIQSAYNDRYVYFLLKWRDPGIDRGCIARFEAPGNWKMHEGEDAALLLFPPPELAARFRDEGLGLFVRDGAFHHPGGEGFADAWYWGAQTTMPHRRARDHWLPPGQRLRGDSQPEKSDNILNWSAEYEGPAGVPQRITGDAQWYLPVPNAQRLDASIMARMNRESNIGWVVPAVLHQQMQGSRADVFARARYVGGVWVLELARLLDTGHRDDLLLGASHLFAVGLYDGTGKGAHIGEYGTVAAVSDPLELDFVSAK